MTRIPSVPLHPHVYEIALQQLHSGARFVNFEWWYVIFAHYTVFSIAAIQSKNLEMIKNNAYLGMDPGISRRVSNVRYEFLPHDGSHLYRIFNKSHGVDVTVRPEQNLHDWLNPHSPHYKPQIHSAIFNYEARTQQSERLKVCISTPEMDTAAWKYTHGKQLILDGTFGVCSSCLLLFIMGINEDQKGVPLALSLFSAPTGNKATHVGYNWEILHKLLQSWKSHLSKGRKTLFYPLVVITDTNTKEHGALQDVWPNIWLLLCWFHLWQCWTNQCKKLMSGKDLDFWKQHVHRRALELEVQWVVI